MNRHTEPSRLLAVLTLAVLLWGSGPANAANINWGLDADGFWDVAGNWVGGVLPGASDVVYFDVGGAVVRTITHRTGPTTIASIQNEEFVDVTNGSTLSISSTRGAINRGTLQANNGTLNLEAINLANAGGTLSAINGGRINLSNGFDLVGGTLSTSSGGAIVVAVGTGVYIYDVTLTSGTQFIASNASSTYLNGTITNNGTITLSSAGNTTDLSLATATTTFAGTGVVSMGNNINNRILGSGTQSLINSAGHTIQGAGQIGVNLTAITNAGLIVANQPAGMTIDPNATGLINTGTLRADGGTLVLSGNGGGVFNNTGGTIDARNSSVVQLSNATIQGGTLTTSTGGIIRNLGDSTLNGLTLAGTFDGANTTTTRLAGSIVVNGVLGLNGSSSNPTSLRVADGTVLSGTGSLTLSNNNQNQVVGNVSGNDRLTIAAGFTVQGAGQIGVNAMALTNQGTIIANQPTTLQIDPRDGADGVINTGTLRADGGTLRLIGGIYSNAAGTIEARNSSLVELSGATIQGGTLTTSTGGIIRNVGDSTLNGLTLAGTFDGANTTTTRLAGSIVVNGVLGLNGSSSNPTSLRVADGTVLSGTGSLTLSNNFQNQVLYNASGNDRLTIAAGFTVQGAGQIGVNAMALTNQGTIVATQSTALQIDTSGSFINQGTLQANAGSTLNIIDSFTNTGTVRANGGTVTANAGFTGSTGTAQIDPGGTLNIGAASTVGTLTHSGTAANSLNLGVNNITVYSAYNNANFSSGNSFSARANVAGTGQILAAGSTPAQAQVITGANVTGGTTTTPTLTIGNVHVGSTTFDYQIVNNNTGGPAIRGAIQTTAGGANITDSRLSGSGVTAGNFGPIVAGSSAPFSITFNAGAAGPLSPPLTGQVVRIANNFDNVAEQNMSIVLGTGAAAYNLANAFIVPSPASVPNQRVGGTATQALTVQNRADAGSYTEGLNTSFGANTGDALNNGGTITRLAGGASNSSAMVVRVNTSTAGFKSGTVTVNTVSDGTGTSGLGLTDIPGGPWVIGVSGNVYNPAAGSATPTPVTIANQRVGGSLTQTLTVANTAPAGAFSEDLNAAFGANTGNATSSGSITGRVAGTNNTGTGTMTVGVDTSAAGARTGTVTINYQTAGAVNGVSNGLGTASAGSQTINVSGNVYRLAAAGAHTPEPVSLGNIHVGGSFGTQALTLQNTAANDGFSERLNASFTGTTGAATATGSFALLAPQASNSTGLVVGLGNANTATAGAKSGTATITLQSDGTGINGFSAVGIGTQTVNVQGTVYRLAQATVNNPAAFDFGSVLVGSGPVTRAISLSNTATADGFSEALNAAFGSFTNNGAGIFANNGGTITGLLAGQTNATAMTVTMTPTSAGTINASVALQFASNGTAIGNGLGVTPLPPQDLPLTVTITGVVGNLAQASAATPNPVNFGKFRVGAAAPAPQALTIGNVATAPAEGLNASIATASSGFTATGAFTSLAPGATNNTSLAVGFTGTGTAGAKSGTATITLASDGTFNSGVPTPLAPQTINMNAEVYRLAQASAHTPEPVTLANQRVGGTATQALSLTNTAANDGYSERLNASIAPTTGQATASGTFALLAAGSTNTSSLRVGVDTATAGAKSGTATITLQSDGTGTSGFGALGIGTQTVNVAGNVYQVAQPAIPASVNLGNVRAGASPTQALTIGNTNVAPGFQEGLDVAVGATTGGATGTGAITNLAAGSTSTAVSVGLADVAAGTQSGTVTLNLASNGTGTSGLAPLSLPDATVTVQATGYRLAAPNTIAAVDFGSVHVGDLATRALTISNTAAADGFSERLNASFGGVSDARITTSGAINLLAAGATDSSSMVVGLNTAAAGTVSGTATVHLQSDGTGTSGLGQTALPDQNVGVAGVITTADVYRLANPVIQTPQPVAFGNVRIGTPVAPQALAIKNDVPDDGFSEKLNASANGTTGGVTASGAFTLLAPQAVNTTSILVGLDTAVAGNRNGVATITFVSDGTGTSGLGQTPLPSQNVSVTGNVFRLAAGNAGDVNLGNVHVGANASGALTVTNTAANDGYSEKLNASVTGFTPAVTGTSGSVSLLAAGSSASTISATLGNVQAGVNNGTVTLAYQSDGTGTTGAPAIGVGTQTVTVQAAGYRLANPVINNPGAFSFGNVHVGDPVQQALSITNSVANDGYSEKLNAGFGGTSDARITTSGSISLLGAGSTDATSMVLGVNTGAAGAVNGTATVTFKSDGTGTSGLGITDLPSQDVTVTATIEGGVYRLANPVIQTPQPVAFGNVRIGTPVASQALAIKNDVPDDGFSEKLNASANGTTGGVTASGAFTLLAPQAVNTTSVLVGLDTAVAGNRNGVATITFVSDGTGTSGLGQTPLPSQNVQVTGNVFRLANPVVNTPTVTLAARVGDASPTAGISLTNSSPDSYTEGLKASVNTVPAGFTNAGGSISNLAAQGTDASTMRVGLVTGTAGSFGGTATLTLASTGAGTSGAPDLALPGQSVSLAGKVYTPAVASVTPASLDFGIVHVGDAVAQKVIAVTNSAPVTALNDVLTGSVSASGPFTASGTLGAGVAAGATDSAGLKVGLSTATAGVYASSATLQLQSHNPDMADLALPDQTVSLAAQVNNYARPIFEQVAGGFSLTQDGSSFTLDFGSVIQGTGLATASLGVRNDVAGPADLLGGTFELGVGSPAFRFRGFTDFADLAAEDLFGGLAVGLDTATLGLFDYSLVLHPYGTNASGFLGSLGDLTLVLHAKVVTSASVPEASTLLLLGIGLAGLAGWRWRTRGKR